ncbi:MAG: hypothetical protein F4004_03830 [Acidimicrobiia bacterium]|nr:hypothetical protein [Acidimicrobiia bacterium]MYC46580.1 hypothetical protein [Acidimicrobiia bacterium]
MTGPDESVDWPEGWRPDPGSPAMVVGDLAVDMTATMAAEPVGWDSNSPTMDLNAGGSAGNVAGALSRLGVPVELCAGVGDDAYGAFATDALRDGGVDVRSVSIIPGAFTLVVIAVADLAGERHFWLYPATEVAASHRFVMTDELAGRARSAGWLHVSGAVMSDEPARSTALGLMEEARAAGVPTSLDLNIRTSDGTVAEDYMASIRRGVAHATVVFGSVAEELPAVVGGTTTEENLTALATSGTIAVGRRGARGAILAVPGHHGVAIEEFAARDVEVVSTLGAGDVFDAGFIAAALHGHSPRQATRWGVDLAAACVASEETYAHLRRHMLDAPANPAG